MKIIVIGSSNDLDGRNLGNIIDNTDTYDLVVRINKPYGSIEDVGVRTDMIIWCKEGFKYYWDGFFKKYKNIKDIIKIAVSNQNIKDILKEKCSNRSYSTGYKGLMYLLIKYPEAEIDVIGYGVLNNNHSNNKFYTHNNFQNNFNFNSNGSPFNNICTLMGSVKSDSGEDINNIYDWELEYNNLKQYNNIKFI